MEFGGPPSRGILISRFMYLRARRNGGGLPGADALEVGGYRPRGVRCADPGGGVWDWVWPGEAKWSYPGVS
jgi:hypothetical protein